jgi:DNA-binding NarL/FixJ family response regulator
MNVRLATKTNHLLIGRAKSKEKLRNILNKALAGNVQVVFVNGEAGIGKTHLVSAIATEASQNNWCIIKGNAHALRKGLSFSPLIQAFRMTLEGISSTEKERLAKDFQYLNVLFPDLGGPVPIPLPHPDIERTRLFENLRLFTIYLASKQPLLFWIENLSHADNETLEWLQYCIKHSEEAPIVFIGTCNTSEDENEGLFQVFEKYLNAQHLLTTMNIGPLSTSESIDLISAHFDGEITDESLRIINSHTLGVPLYINEMLNNLKNTGGINKQNGSWNLKSGVEGYIPSSINSLLELRFDGLSIIEKDLLILLAVSNDSVPWLVLQQASKLKAEEFMDHVGALLKKGFLQEDEKDNELFYKFLHPMLKTVFTESIHYTIVQQAHDKMYKAWYEKDTMRAAFHLLSTGRDFCEHEAVKILFDAGQRYLTLGSYHTASEYLIHADQMIKQASTYTDTEMHWRIKLALSEALTNVGKQDEAMILLNDLFYNTIEVNKRISIKRWMAWIEVNRSYEEGMRHIKDGLELWDGKIENEDVLWLLNEQVFNHLNSEKLPEAMDSMACLKDYVQKFPSPRSELLCSIREAHVALMNWNGRTFNLDIVNEILPKAYQIGEPELIYDVYCLFGYIALNHGDFKQSLRFAKECSTLVKREGMVIHEISVRLLGMSALFMRGSWSDALIEAEEIEKMARAYEIKAAVVCTLDMRALIKLLQGNNEESLVLLHESEQLIHDVFPDGGPHSIVGSFHIVRAVDYLIGDNKMALNKPMVYWANAHSMKLFLKLIESFLLIETSCEGEVRTLIKQLQYATPEKKPNYVSGMIDLLRGLLSKNERDEKLKLSYLNNAVHVFKTLNLPIEYALARVALAEASNGEQRNNILKDVQGEFKKLGAHALAKWVNKKLQVNKDLENSNGIIENLTNREIDILEALSSGLSNKEIAKHFGLTEGTVKIHLVNLYGKLGVNRRVQAVNRARELNMIN